MNDRQNGQESAFQNPVQPTLPNPLCIKSHLDQNHATAFGFNNVLAEKLANYIIDDCAQLIQTKYEKTHIGLSLSLCCWYDASALKNHTQPDPWPHGETKPMSISAAYDLDLPIAKTSTFALA